MEERRQSYLKRRKVVRRIALGLLLLILVSFGLYKYHQIYPELQAELSSIPKGGDWPMYRRDLSHTGSADQKGAITQGVLKWVFSSGGAIHSSAAVANGIVYFGSRDGKLYALRAATGSKMWEFQTHSWVDSSPAIVDGVVYFGSNDGGLYALDALTGKKLWYFEAGLGVMSSPAVAGDMVVFGCDDYFVYAVNTKTGTEIVRLLKELNVEDVVTVICSTHDYKMITSSERVCWMRDGNLDRISRGEDFKLEEMDADDLGRE